MNELNGIIEIDHPNNNIYQVEGTLLRDNQKFNFDINQILLRVSSMFKFP